MERLLSFLKRHSMYKDKKSVIKIDKAIYEELKHHAQMASTSITNLIIFTLKDFLSNMPDNEIKNFFVVDGRKEIRIRLNNEEMMLLDAAKKEHGFTSLKRECEFRVLNSLHDKKEYFTNTDIKIFAELKTELNAIGRNLNVIAKKIQSKTAVINYENLERFLNNIKEDINKSTILLNEKIERSVQ